jgi:hypothetical protein
MRLRNSALTDELLRKIPKAELHIHIEVSLVPEMMFEMAARNEVRLRWGCSRGLRLLQASVLLGSLLRGNSGAALRTELLRVDLGVPEEGVTQVLRGYVTQPREKAETGRYHLLVGPRKGITASAPRSGPPDHAQSYGAASRGRAGSPSLRRCGGRSSARRSSTR